MGDPIQPPFQGLHPEHDQTTPESTPDTTPVGLARAKPEKPAGSPLFPHQAGQWAKKIKGKIHYFGKWDDYRAALRKYKMFIKEEGAAEQPIVTVASVAPSLGNSRTVHMLVNSYLARRKADAETGQITWNTWENYKSVARELKKFFGGDTDIRTLTSEHFARFKLSVVNRYSVSSISRIVILTRTMFNWAYKPWGGLPAPPDFGDAFTVPTTAQKRQAKSEMDPFYSAEELRAQLAAAGEPLRTWIYLGLNGGMGSMDIAELEVKHVDLSKGLLDMLRGKTKIRRVVALWPETVEGLRLAMGDKTEGRIFQTELGRPMTYRIQGKTGKGFYTLRHVFHTVALNGSSENVLAWVMGHARRGQGENSYTAMPPYKTIQKATRYVRDWLMGLETIDAEAVDFTQKSEWDRKGSSPESLP